MAQSWLRRFSWEASMTGRLRLMSSCVVAVLGAAIAIEALRAGSIL
jgi:hypothetical protein